MFHSVLVLISRRIDLERMINYFNTFCRCERCVHSNYGQANFLRLFNLRIVAHFVVCCKMWPTTNRNQKLYTSYQTVQRCSQVGQNSDSKVRSYESVDCFIFSFASKFNHFVCAKRTHHRLQNVSVAFFFLVKSFILWMQHKNWCNAWWKERGGQMADKKHFNYLNYQFENDAMQSERNGIGTRMVRRRRAPKSKSNSKPIKCFLTKANVQTKNRYNDERSLARTFNTDRWYSQCEC